MKEIREGKGKQPQQENKLNHDFFFYSSDG